MCLRSAFIIGFLCVVALGGVVSCSDSESPTGVTPNDSTDTSPPAPVADAALMFSDETGQAILEWTAPHDDSPTETVAGYEILFAYTRGYYPSDFWEMATPVSNPPTPAEPGTRQRYTFEDTQRARDLYVGIRSRDENGNRSSSSELATVHITGYTFAGRCVNVFSKAPLPGLDLRLSTGTTYQYTTDANGGFTHATDLDDGITHIDITTGTADMPYHRLDQSFILSSDSVHTFYMIPVEPVDAPWTPNLLSLANELFEFFPSGNVPSGNILDGNISSGSAPIYNIPDKTVVSSGNELAGTLEGEYTVLAKWHTHPVPLYIPPFVNDKGIDYEPQARAAAQRWNDRTGESLFAFVDTPPDTGIIVVYKPESEMGIGLGVTRHKRGVDGHPIRDEVWIIDNISDPSHAYTIFLHEFGHTIALGHVEDRNFIMYVGQPLPDDISDDEVRVVQLHEALPTRIDMAIYDQDVSKR